MPYTEYTYSDLTLFNDSLTLADSLDVGVPVTNNGSVAGDEIIQLYISDPVAMRVRPVRELKEFLKIHLDAGESKRVNLSVPVGKMGYHDDAGKYSVEPGEFRVYVGADSNADLFASFQVLA